MAKNSVGTPGGSDKQVQFNNGDYLDGIDNGTAAQVLTSRGASLPPSFQASTTGAVSVDTDGALAADSDVLVASQKATKTYADTKVAGALDTDGALAADSDANVASQKATQTYADTKVSKSGNETIAGVKTFSSMPSIPTNTPATAGATGATGQICWDATHIYVCVATNTWVKATLASW